MSNVRKAWRRIARIYYRKLENLRKFLIVDIFYHHSQDVQDETDLSESFCHIYLAATEHTLVKDKEFDPIWPLLDYLPIVRENLLHKKP